MTKFKHVERKIYDFSESLIRCHAIYYIMQEGKERTPKRKYEDLCTLLVEEMTKYEAMGERVQGMKSGLSKAAKIAGIEYEISKMEPFKNDDPLTTGAKSYLKRLYGEVKYGKNSIVMEKGTKYMNKGKLAEQESLDLISFIDGVEYKKNEQRVKNEFVTGIPDSFRGKSVYEAEYVPDVKSSWSFETFIENVGKPLNPIYWWQLQGYFDLTGASLGEVSYCLVNTPLSIIEEEKAKLQRRMDAATIENPEYKEAERNLINSMTFDDIPVLERRLKFEVKRDEDAIQKLHDKIPQCRDYLFEIQEKHLLGFFTDKELPILETIEEI